LNEIPDELIEREGNADSGEDSRRYAYKSQAERGYSPPPMRHTMPLSSAQPQTPHHGLKLGDDIEHPTFGEGVILEIRGEGEKAEATIRFRLVGTKHLSLAWAPLKKL
jgi:DNA helicase-2/ATP-dependent DNA helicase PcrA